MNAQTAAKKAVNVNRVAIRYAGFTVKNRDVNAVNAVARPSYLLELNNILTNGDPPKLMLWGSED